MLYCVLTLHSPKALVFYIKHICLLALSERGQFPPFKGFSPLVLQFPLSRRAKSHRMLGLLCSISAPYDIRPFPIPCRYSLPKCQSEVIMVRSFPDIASLFTLTAFPAYVALRSRLICSTSGRASAAIHASFGKGRQAERLQSSRKWGGKWKLLTRERFAECCKCEEECRSRGINHKSLSYMK